MLVFLRPALSALNSPINVGHSNFLEPTLIIMMKGNSGYINFQLMPNL